MSDVAIAVEGLGKRYRIGAGPAEPYGNIRESIMRAACAPLRRLRGAGRTDALREAWALRDVSFEVKHGEAIGIIGRNGAGKSTLLKVLSRITEPTTGRAVVHGRVGSLLEVGTGFHPELTGRENIYLNGAVMGMSRADIKRRFDEIIDFSGVEKYLDTPVKRYSSGMYTRLAFAVAAHLEPEVLVVDEVLAVGDAEFQKKCLGKMRDVSRSGRTVLFVSHNMAAVEHLCSRSMVLKNGTVEFEGRTADCIKHYSTLLHHDLATGTIHQRADRSGSGRIRLTGFQLENGDGQRMPFARSGQDVYFTLSYAAEHDVHNVDVGISLHDESDRMLAVHYAEYSAETFPTVSPRGVFRFLIRNMPLSAGSYKVGARVIENGIEADWPRDGIGSMDVESGDFYGTGRIGFEGRGLMLLDGHWSVTEHTNVAGGLKS